MSYETKVQLVRSLDEPPDELWTGDDGDYPEAPRAVITEGGPLPGDEVVHALYGRCTVERLLPFYAIKCADGVVVSALAKQISPAPDPTEALREKILGAIDSRGTYESMADSVMDVLKAEGLLGDGS